MKSWAGVRSVTSIGSPSSGKTFCIHKILQIRNKLFMCKDTDPEMRILYCYSIHQQINRQFLNIVVIDDLFQEVYHSTKASLNWLWYEGRHLNLCTLFSTHNYTAPGSRIININTRAMLLFRSVFAASVLQTIARQAFVGKTRILKSCYDDAMSREQYSFVCLDFNPHYDDDQRISTNNFSDNDETVLYVLE